MTSPPRSERMELLLGAAVHVIAEHGLRGLTHRAVDREAGLAEGSCSAYLRTREALVQAVTSYVADRVAGHVRDLAAELVARPLEDAQPTGPLTDAVLRWVEEREVLVARLELTIQASRDPALADTLGVLHDDLVDVVAGILRARGKPHCETAAETLVSAIDGVLIGALPLHPRERTAFVRRSVEALVAGLG